MTCSQIPGRKAKTFLNEGTFAAPAWTEIVRISDEEVSPTKGQVELNDRETDWIAQLAGGKELEETFTYHKKRGVGTDPLYDKFWDSFYNDTAIELAIMDGDLNNIPTNGVDGIRAYFQVFEQPQTRELDTVLETEFTLVHTCSEDQSGNRIPPSRYQVSS